MRPARASAATVGLLILLAGVPFLLYALGGGLPTSLPSAHQVHRFLGQPISDTAIVRGVSLICWALWALFVAAVASEAAAWIAGRPSPSQSHRGVRIPGLQHAAAALFLTAVVLLPQRTPNTVLPANAPVPLARPVSVTAVVADGHGSPTANPSERVNAATPASGLPTSGIPSDWERYTVNRYDTLWAIAETHLGDPLRWKEIKDGQGNTFATGTDQWVEVSGRLIDEAQSRLIFPGQHIWLPPDATAILPTGDRHPTPPTTPSRQPSAPLPAPVQGDPPVHAQPLPDPDHTAPTVAAPARGPAASAPTLSGRARAPGPAPDGHVAAGQYRVRTADETERLVEVSSAILASGMVAAAALSTIRRLRRRQSRTTPPERRLRLPDPRFAGTEMSLRVAARHGAVGSVHAAVHTLAADLATAGLAAPVVCGVLAGEAGVEMLLDQPMSPPPGWEVTGGGFRWRPVDPTHLFPRRWTGPEPLPILVPIGRVPGTTTEVLLNLEAGGFVALSGDPDATEGLAHAAAFALAGLPWAQAADIILVGFGEYLAAAEPHIRFVSRLTDIAGELQHLVEVTGAADTSASIGGLADRQGDLPTAILCARELDDQQRAWVRSLCDTARISAFLPDSAADGLWVIYAGQGPVLIPPLRVTVEAPCPPVAERDALDAIVAAGLDTDGVLPDEPPYDRLAEPVEPDARRDPLPGNGPAIGVPTGKREAVQPTPAGTPAGEQQADVTVSVLGAVEFIGAGEFRRPRSKEIAVYLAMHPEGVSERRLDETIWPTRTDVPASTRDPAISSARSALGGPDRFPYAQGHGPEKRYTLTEQVSTDWQHFIQLCHHGRRAGDVEMLCDALRMVRGRPFGDLDGGPGYEWLHVEGHLHHVEGEIADAADLAAQILLGAAEPVEARWAANQGLLGAPYSERLWVHLMAAADALGEAQEVERVLSEMDRRLGLDGDFESLHPDTVAAYRRYSRRQRSTAR